MLSAAIRPAGPATSVWMVAGVVALLAARIAAAAPQTFKLSGRVLRSSGKSVVYVALWQADGFLKRPVQQVRIVPGAAPVFQVSLKCPPVAGRSAPLRIATATAFSIWVCLGPRNPAASGALSPIGINLDSTRWPRLSGRNTQTPTLPSNNDGQRQPVEMEGATSNAHHGAQKSASRPRKPYLGVKLSPPSSSQTNKRVYDSGGRFGP